MATEKKKKTEEDIQSEQISLQALYELKKETNTNSNETCFRIFLHNSSFIVLQTYPPVCEHYSLTLLPHQIHFRSDMHSKSYPLLK